MFYRSISVSSAASGADVAAAQADARSREAKGEAEILRFEIERLLMISEAMWGILKEKFGCTDADLVNRVIEIDRRDGRVDGRVAASPPPMCPRCHRTLERKRPFCLYCGQLIARDPFER
jgi:hypothetical protein